MNNLTGVLLINLGTPDQPRPWSVAKYLMQFLNDPRVIELPAAFRWLLVHVIIVPMRCFKSAATYKKIWDQNGSPLLYYSNQIKDKLAKSLGATYVVSLGMCYGKPSIKSALDKLQKAGVKKIIVLPLFPQYSSAVTGSALEEVLKITAKYPVIPELIVKPEYFQHPDFIQALSTSIEPYLQKDYDYLLMSYHGLPERQMLHNSGVAHCDMQQACPEINVYNQNCYRAQCYQTSRLIAKRLKLEPEKWGVGFQSRLGKLPWIKPYTDQLLSQLRAQGISKLVICCPSFVVDCLETLEEIGIRAREQWLGLGGKELRLVPCLNAIEPWIKVLGTFCNVNRVHHLLPVTENL